MKQPTKTIQPPDVSKKSPATGTGIFTLIPPTPKGQPSPALPITGPQKSGK